MIVGTLSAILLVMVSPNLTYPLAVKAAQEKIVAAETAKLSKFQTDLAAATEVPAQDRIKAEIAKSEKTKSAAETRIKDLGGDRTSIMGLEKPLFELRNPGLVSIPLGFLAVIIGSVFYRDKRAEDMWDELYVRQNTGILAAKAQAH
jgi:cation/acetate symporter